MILLDILGEPGHKQATFDDDPSPKKRRELAEEVSGLMKDGYTCFLKDGSGEDHKITGYDIMTNSWMTLVRGELVPAPQSVVTASRAIQGG